MIEPRKVGRIEEGDVYQGIGPLDEQVKAFERIGIPFPYITDVERIAEIRLKDVSQDYSRTSIMPLAIKGGRTVLYRNSILMHPLFSSLAVNDHRNGKYFTRSADVYEAAFQTAKGEEDRQPEDRSAIVLPNGDFDLSSGMDTAKFLFRRFNEDYFERFGLTIPFRNLQGDSKKEATVNYVWFSDPQNDSRLNCRYRDLNNNSRAFGVLPVFGEAGAQNFETKLREEYRAKESELLTRFDRALDILKGK